jgi:hypothetical protein
MEKKIDLRYFLSKKIGKIMTIDLIPTYVLGEIFSLIGSSDVKSCMLVCKKWKKAMNADILKRFIGPCDCSLA